MSVYCTLFSQTFYGLLFSYLTITDVTLYLQIIDFQFLSCCTSQPKKRNQIITVNSSTNASIPPKKLLHALRAYVLKTEFRKSRFVELAELDSLAVAYFLELNTSEY